MKFYEKIKKIRVDNNLTQEEMANKLFVSRSLIAKWEQDRGIPGIDMLNTIATTFNLSVNDLITEEEIKLITLKNNQEVEQNKKHLKLTIIISVIAILLLVVISLFIIDRYNLFNDDKPVIIDYETRGEIVDLKDDVVIIGDKERTYEIKWDHLDSKLDRYGNKITYDFLKVGHYVDISGTYNITYKEYTFKELTVIEEYLDDYEIYGIVITLDNIIPTSLPLWGTNLDEFDWLDRPKDDAYPCYIYTMGSSSSGHQEFKHNYFETFINHLENNNQVVGFEIDLKITMAVDKKVNIFVIDNSKEGFYLYQSIEAPMGYPKLTKININGYTVNESLKQSSKTEFYDYSLRADYVLNIYHGYASEYYTIYEYDAKNQLINETSFSTLEEFNDKFKKAQEETVYCIIKNFGNVTTKKVYLGEQYSFKLVDEFGYIYTFDRVIR